MASVCIGLVSLFSSPFGLAGEKESRWYLGGQIGWGLYQDACGEQALDCEDNAAAFGLFGGYQLSPRWQIEATYLDPADVITHYPRLSSAPLAVTGSMDILDLSLLYNLPLSSQWKLQLRGGAAYWDAKTNSREFAFEREGASPSAGMALEWAMNNAWAGRVGYQYFYDLGDEDTGSADLHLFSVGMRYRFGASSTKSAVAPVAISAVTQSSIAKATPMELNQLVYFELNLDYTNQLGQLAPIVDRLKQNPQTKVELIGFADSTGEARYNQQLSQRRAEFVAGYLRSHGVGVEQIIVRGRGERELTTGLGHAADDRASRRVVVRILDAATQEVQP